LGLTGIALLLASIALGQQTSSTPQTAGQAGAIIEEVIVTARTFRPQKKSGPIRLTPTAGATSPGSVCGPPLILSKSLQNEVAGYVKDGSPNTGKDKNVMPVSTPEYNPCGWRAWLNNTTITLGVNNVFDEQPPFVAAASENGYDEQTTNIKGRMWYVALKKRF
jgi:hypothetical protein